MSILIKGIDMPPRRNYIRGYYIDGDGSVTNLSRTKVVGEAVQYIEPERKKMCPYCFEDSDGYVKPLEKNSHAFIRFGMDGWEIDISAKGWHGSAKIRYCPMCGRKLSKGEQDGET